MISNTTISAKYTVTAGVLQFSIPFRIYKTTDVSVFWSSDGKSDTTLTLGTDYSVAIGSEGGTVTLVSGKVPVGSILAIEPNFTATQETDLSSTTAISTEALEAQLDKQTLLILQQQRRTGRAVILPATSSESPEDVVQSIYASRDAAAASASEASTQATAAAGSAQAASKKAADAAASAAASAQSAANAYAASEGMAPRMDAVESKNIQQDTRLDVVEASATAINSALSGKANQAMDNLTSAGSGKVANYAMPSQRTAAISVPSSTAATVPAPAAGFIKFVGTSSAANQYIRVSNATLSYDKMLWSSATGQLLALMIQVRKNDTVRVEYTAPTSLSMIFVFAEGAY